MAGSDVNLVSTHPNACCSDNYDGLAENNCEWEDMTPWRASTGHPKARILLTKWHHKELQVNVLIESKMHESSHVNDPIFGTEGNDETRLMWKIILDFLGLKGVNELCEKQTNKKRSLEKLTMN